jgi:hypothetical protein
MKAPQFPRTPEGSSPVFTAVEILWDSRHHLSPDVLGSLAAIVFCGDAARYGQRPDLDMPAEYRAHDVAECEAGS